MIKLNENAVSKDIFWTIHKYLLKPNKIKGLPQPTQLLKIKFPKKCLFESNKFITKREIYKDSFMKMLNKIFTFAKN